jgi:hypothetical protein
MAKQKKEIQEKSAPNVRSAPRLGSAPASNRKQERQFKDVLVLLLPESGIDINDHRSKLVEKYRLHPVREFVCTYSSHDKRQEKHDLEVTLKQAVVFARGLKHARLVIDRFFPFESDTNRHLLELLDKSDLEFSFLDFENLDKDNIHLLVTFMEKKSEHRREKHLVAAVLAEPVNRSYLQEEDVRLRSIRKKKQSAFADAINAEVRKKIGELLPRIKTYSNIAQALNEAGYTTSRGNRFHAQTVKRHLKAIEEIRERFKEYDDVKYEINEEVMGGGGNLKPLQVRFPGEKTDFSETIAFELEPPLEVPFEVEVLDNDGDTVFSETYSEGGARVEIDIFRDTTLYPGLHYLIVRPKEKYSKVTEKITILKELNIEGSIS